MALVAYDYDSNSEDEEDDSIRTSSCIINDAKTNTADEINEHSKEIKLQTREITSQSNLFSSLPQTRTNVRGIIEDQIEDFIPKSKDVSKEKQKVKITIPSLSQFIDVNDDEPQMKKPKQSVKGSGLISILPPVKGIVTTTKTFVPNVVANKNKNNNFGRANATISTTNLIPNALRKKVVANNSALPYKIPRKVDRQCGSDIESDDDIDMPENFDDEMWQKVCGRPKPKQIIQKPEETPPQEVIDIAPEPEKPYDGLDNKAFKELVGKSKRPIGNIKLIDINEEEILPEKDIWMTKSLTDPEMAPKPQIEDPVDPTRRKKHHITYLAQQAKANEQELQNAWSASKNNRMATRAKYGF